MSGYKDHTHRSGKKKRKKKKFNSPVHPSQSERDAGREGGEGRRAERECLYILRYHCNDLQLDVITYDSHAAQINSQEQNEGKKLDIHKQRSPFKSDVAARVRPQLYSGGGKKTPKKNRLPPHQLKCDCTLPSSSNDQRDKDSVYRKLTETHSGPNVRLKTFDLHADCLTTNTKTRRENILCSAHFGRGAITFHRPTNQTHFKYPFIHQKNTHTAV